MTTKTYQENGGISSADWAPFERTGPDRETRSSRTYLGDSVWAAREGQYIALTVGPQDGEPDIYLDDTVIQGLVALYVKNKPLSES